MLGAENFSTEVHADVDFSESQSTRESYPKDDRALRREEGNKSTNSATQSAAGGIPGALSNKVPQATQVAVAPGGVQTTATPSTPTSTGEVAETYSRNFDVGREISVTHQPIGRVRRFQGPAFDHAADGGERLKVPHMGWNAVTQTRDRFEKESAPDGSAWEPSELFGMVFAFSTSGPTRTVEMASGSK